METFLDFDLGNGGAEFRFTKTSLELSHYSNYILVDFTPNEMIRLIRLLIAHLDCVDAEKPVNYVELIGPTVSVSYTETKFTIKTPHAQINLSCSDFRQDIVETKEKCRQFIQDVLN